MSVYPDFAKVDWHSDKYDLISVEDTETETIVTIRGKKYGGKGIMHIPHHTDAEMQAIYDNLFDTAARIYERLPPKKTDKTA